MARLTGPRPTRREVLRAGLGAALTLAPARGMPRMPPEPRRPRLAVILTQYGATSHGVCYCTKFLEGKQFDDHFEAPLCDVAAIHLMEIARDDVGAETAKKHDVPVYP